MAFDKDLKGVDLEEGDELAQLGLRIGKLTISWVKYIAEYENRTISSAADWLLWEAIHKWKRDHDDDTARVQENDR